MRTYSINTRTPTSPPGVPNAQIYAEHKYAEIAQRGISLDAIVADGKEPGCTSLYVLLSSLIDPSPEVSIEDKPGSAEGNKSTGVDNDTSSTNMDEEINGTSEGETEEWTNQATKSATHTRSRGLLSRHLPITKEKYQMYVGECVFRMRKRFTIACTPRTACQLPI